MDIYENYQAKLLPYAYNILGSIEDARDVIQDVIINHIESNRNNIDNESAYLIKSVINKSINLKKRRKKTVGQSTWLPEPIATDAADKKINSQEIISYALLVLLERLNPRERAVFILREAFGYSHQEVAEVFSISIENSRQLLNRAKSTLKKERFSFKPSNPPANDFLSKYVEFIRNGELKMLEDMLADHITAQADDGGKGRLLSEFTSGIKAVAALLVKGYKYLERCQIKFQMFNHSPALLFYKADKLICCQILNVDEHIGKIDNIYVVADAEKLTNI
jgi:RNA polymerase sigma factor (sigma-70 family)